jgi:hypothetical protein
MAVTHDDVAGKLKSEMRPTGKAFREVLNETRRRGLASRRPPGSHAPFEVRTRDLGELKPGLTPDNVADLVERAEGALHQ